MLHIMLKINRAIDKLLCHIEEIFTNGFFMMGKLGQTLIYKIKTH